MLNKKKECHKIELYCTALMAQMFKIIIKKKSGTHLAVLIILKLLLGQTFKSL